MQRKVGFEFETSDLVLIGPSNSMELHKPVVVGNGWGMYVDMAPEEAGKHACAGHVEFVVDAVEEDADGWTQLNTALGEIQDFTNKMLTTWSGWGPLKAQQVPLHKLLGGSVNWAAAVAARDGREQIVVEIRNRKPTAAPQMTAGIKLGQTIAVHEHFGSYAGGIDFVGKGNDPELRNAERAFFKLTAAVATKQSLDDDLYALNEQQCREYAGAIAQLSHIIVLGQLRTNLEREKYASSILSRTNLGRLPDFIRKHPKFKQHVLAAAGELGGRRGPPDERARLFVSEKIDAISVGRWLDEIIAGRDPLTWGQEMPERWAPQLVGRPENRGWGTVFEFRGIAEGLAIADWRNFACTGHTWVTGINASIDTSPNVQGRGVDYGTDYTIPATPGGASTRPAP